MNDVVDIALKAIIAKLEGVTCLAIFGSRADAGELECRSIQPDTLRRLATARCLEILCEGARKLADEIKRGTSKVDWRKMNDFANLLRHAYHTIKVDIVWDIVQNHVPALKSFVEQQIRSRQTDSDGRTQIVIVAQCPGRSESAEPWSCPASRCQPSLATQSQMPRSRPRRSRPMSISTARSRPIRRWRSHGAHHVRGLAGQRAEAALGGCRRLDRPRPLISLACPGKSVLQGHERASFVTRLIPEDQYPANGTDMRAGLTRSSDSICATPGPATARPHSFSMHGTLRRRARGAPRPCGRNPPARRLVSTGLLRLAHIAGHRRQQGPARANLRTDRSERCSMRAGDAHAERCTSVPAPSPAVS